MAPGYVIALALEAAGILGLMVGLVRLRTERLARASELRGLLLTGNATAALASAGRAASIPTAQRVVLRSVPPERARDADAARAALHRALGIYTQPERSAA
ncbi:MAG: hypothetical protein INR70_09545 [Parafilimonas terrae]|nr:hypothetical protein [Parafilimonas terrae]